MTMQELESLLDKARRTHRGVVACCPAHHDHNPSFSAREGENGILVKCWAGCSVDEICTAMGIGVKDLFYDVGEPKTRQAIEQRRAKRIDWKTEARAFSNAAEEAHLKHEKMQDALKGVETEGWRDDEFEQAWKCVDKVLHQQQRANHLEDTSYAIREKGIRGEYENVRERDRRS
ncbi:MAG: hypothetical protein NPIRA02_40220 [Nitrospirales bacterium]|nr:MAG: hypothetical protein NPIRA02_40220 [Nitrospirales bacterium]